MQGAGADTQGGEGWLEMPFLHNLALSGFSSVVTTSISGLQLVNLPDTHPSLAERAMAQTAPTCSELRLSVLFPYLPSLCLRGVSSSSNLIKSLPLKQQHRKRC